MILSSKKPSFNCNSSHIIGDDGFFKLILKTNGFFKLYLMKLVNRI